MKFLLILLVAVLIYFWMKRFNNKIKVTQKQIWNKGKCPYCGEEWVMVRHENNMEVRIYRCRNMHKCTITFDVDKREEL